MKKINIILIALFVFLIGINNTNAMTLKPSGSSAGKRGEEITLYLTLEKSLDEKEVSAVDGIFSYDDSVLTFLGSSMVTDNWTEFMLINNNKVFSYANLTFDNLITTTNQNIIKMLFKINDNASFGDTVVCVTNSSATDGNGDGISIEGGNHTVKILSNINALTSIKVEGADIDFKENTNNYDLIIDSASTIIKVTKKDNNSTVTGDIGTVNLNYGLNTFSIKVKSESGLTRTYTLNITRPDNRSKDNTLSSLNVSTEIIKFNKDILNYTLTVQNSISTISIGASLTDSKSSFVENYGPRTVNLNVGENKIQIKVKAENDEIKIYTINVLRSEKDNLEDNDITNNNKTGDLLIIPICLLAVLSLGIIIYYIRKKKIK